jgi:hypothetical protein
MFIGDEMEIIFIHEASTATIGGDSGKLNVIWGLRPAT